MRALGQAAVHGPQNWRHGAGGHQQLQKLQRLDTRADGERLARERLGRRGGWRRRHCEREQHLERRARDQRSALESKAGPSAHEGGDRLGEAVVIARALLLEGHGERLEQLTHDRTVRRVESIAHVLDAELEQGVCAL